VLIANAPWWLAVLEWFDAHYSWILEDCEPAAHIGGMSIYIF